MEEGKIFYLSFFIMPVILENLTSQLVKNITQTCFIVQYPFVIEAKEFANIYFFHTFKILQVVVNVVNPSTTLTSFSIFWESNEIQREIPAGSTQSSIWVGEKIINANTKLRFRNNTAGTGSFVTITVEGEYVY